ncbi:MFS transporter [Haloarcula onubensis]|uniref:MFS transporter n=1 Tax=Haloarcula onubensis TaxID=2950539 RepID=A0ABU2FRK7_9EURY|nr:MFS transporter [Halomicroarcula sp. S3CR25-11]MDS0282877.1 MFS transporter [Halomicroarcula sp. S3CR25-11]
MAPDRWLSSWALASVALGATSLLIPLYFVTIGGSTLLLGVLAGTAAAAGAPGALLFGRLADGGGNRRALVLVALGLAAAAIAVVSATDAIWLVIAGNAVLWFAAGAVAPVLTLLVTVGSPERDWPGRFAALNRYQGWGWAGGLVLGLAWTTALSGPLGVVYAQRTLLWVCAGVTAAAALLAARWLPREPSGDETAPRPSHVARALARSRRLPVRSATFPVGPARLYWLTRSLHPRQLAARLTPSLSLYFVAVVAVFTGFGVFWGPLPSYLAGTLDYGSGVVFTLYLLSSLGSALCFGLAGRLAERYDTIGLQAGGLLARAVLHPAVAVVGLAVPAGSLGLLTNGVVFGGIGVAWAVVAITAAAIVTRLAPPAIRGEALGLYTAISGLATGVGSVAGGWLGGYGFTLAFGVAGGFVLVGTLLVALIWRRTARAEQTAATPTESL